MSDYLPAITNSIRLGNPLKVFQKSEMSVLIRGHENCKWPSRLEDYHGLVLGKTKTFTKVISNEL